MAWFMFFLGLGMGALFICSSFQNVGLGTVCGLSFVAAGVYEVASAVRQLAETPSSQLRPRVLSAKSPRLAESLDPQAEPPAI